MKITYYILFCLLELARQQVEALFCLLRLASRQFIEIY